MLGVEPRQRMMPCAGDAFARMLVGISSAARSGEIGFRALMTLPPSGTVQGQ